jgi:cytosine/creatinine deaminase
VSIETLRSVRVGTATVDLVIERGRIARMTPARGPATALALPPLVDAHVHLDKTYVAHRITARPASLFEAIDLAAADKARWTEADLRARAGRALARAEANGIAALRSHVDWSEPERPLAWDVIGDLAEAWRGRVDVQRAALVPLDLLGDPDLGPGIAASVARDGGVLGAFVYRNDHLPARLEQVFALAIAHDLALDFHVDEGLEREAQGFDTIVALTARHGLGGRVLCGHACALSIRPEHEVAALLEAAAEAGVALTVLPTTNGYLQDARPGRTPRLRGLAPMQEARAAGMDVLVALDNVADAFYPYGDYDLLDAWRLAVVNARLDPETWLDAITTLPARALGLPEPALTQGGPADFVLLDAGSPADLVGRLDIRRTVWRDGRPLSTVPEPIREPA